MADLHFVDFALISSLVRKEKQFKIPDDFHYSLMDDPFRVPFSCTFSSFHITDRPLFGDPQNVFHDEDMARNFNISTLRGRVAALTLSCRRPTYSFYSV